MLALCTAVTLERLLRKAYSKAYCAMRRVASRVMTLSDSATPGTTSCSMPLNSPSMFSRTMTMSTLSWREAMPGMLKGCTTLAKSASDLRSSTLMEGLVPLPMPVLNSPLRMQPVRRQLDSASGVSCRREGAGGVWMARVARQHSS